MIGRKSICLIISAIVALIFVAGIVIAVRWAGSNTLKPSDKFIADPHAKDPAALYKIMNVTDHPNYAMVKKNGSLNSEVKSKNYTSVYGGSEGSDFNSLLYLLYSDLRDPGLKAV